MQNHNRLATRVLTALAKMSRDPSQLEVEDSAKPTQHLENVAESDEAARGARFQGLDVEKNPKVPDNPDEMAPPDSVRPMFEHLGLKMRRKPGKAGPQAELYHKDRPDLPIGIITNDAYHHGGAPGTIRPEAILGREGAQMVRGFATSPTFLNHVRGSLKKPQANEADPESFLNVAKQRFGNLEPEGLNEPKPGQDAPQLHVDDAQPPLDGPDPWRVVHEDKNDDHSLYHDYSELLPPEAKAKGKKLIVHEKREHAYQSDGRGPVKMVMHHAQVHGPDSDFRDRSQRQDNHNRPEFSLTHTYTPAHQNRSPRDGSPENNLYHDYGTSFHKRRPFSENPTPEDVEAYRNEDAAFRALSHKLGREPGSSRTVSHSNMGHDNSTLPWHHESPKAARVAEGRTKQNLKDSFAKVGKAFIGRFQHKATQGGTPKYSYEIYRKNNISREFPTLEEATAFGDKMHDGDIPTEATARKAHEQTAQTTRRMEHPLEPVAHPHDPEHLTRKIPQGPKTKAAKEQLADAIKVAEGEGYQEPAFTQRGSGPRKPLPDTREAKELQLRRRTDSPDAVKRAVAAKELKDFRNGPLPANTDTRSVMQRPVAPTNAEAAARAAGTTGDRRPAAEPVGRATNTRPYADSPTSRLKHELNRLRNPTSEKDKAHIKRVKAELAIRESADKGPGTEPHLQNMSGAVLRAMYDKAEKGSKEEATIRAELRRRVQDISRRDEEYDKSEAAKADGGYIAPALAARRQHQKDVVSHEGKKNARTIPSLKRLVGRQATPPEVDQPEQFGQDERPSLDARINARAHAAEEARRNEGRKLELSERPSKTIPLLKHIYKEGTFQKALSRDPNLIETDEGRNGVVRKTEPRLLPGMLEQAERKSIMTSCLTRNFPLGRARTKLPTSSQRSVTTRVGQPRTSPEKLPSALDTFSKAGQPGQNLAVRTAAKLYRAGDPGIKDGFWTDDPAYARHIQQDKPLHEATFKPEAKVAHYEGQVDKSKIKGSRSVGNHAASWPCWDWDAREYVVHDPRMLDVKMAKVESKAEACDRCHKDATVKVLYAEGHAYVPACDSHKEEVAKPYRAKDDFSGFKELHKAQPLEKRSKNVKAMTSNISNEQADSRRSRYAQSLGLISRKIPRSVSFSQMGVKGSDNPSDMPTLAYGGSYSQAHELGHAMMTPVGGNVERRTARLGVSEPEAVREEDTINNSLEHKIDRRAGVDNKMDVTGWRGHKQPMYAGKITPVDRDSSKEAVALFDSGAVALFDSGARFGHDTKVLPNAAAKRLMVPAFHKFEPLEKRSRNVKEAVSNITPAAKMELAKTSITTRLMRMAPGLRKSYPERASAADVEKLVSDIHMGGRGNLRGLPFDVDEYKLARVPVAELPDAMPKSDERATRYSQQSATTAPPIVTGRRGTGLTRVYDGHHRVKAARLRGEQDVLAYVPA